MITVERLNVEDLNLLRLTAGEQLLPTPLARPLSDRRRQITLAKRRAHLSGIAPAPAPNLRKPPDPCTVSATRAAEIVPAGCARSSTNDTKRQRIPGFDRFSAARNRPHWSRVSPVLIPSG